MTKNERRNDCPSLPSILLRHDIPVDFRQYYNDVLLRDRQSIASENPVQYCRSVEEMKRENILTLLGGIDNIVSAKVISMNRFLFTLAQKPQNGIEGISLHVFPLDKSEKSVALVVLD